MHARAARLTLATLTALTVGIALYAAAGFLLLPWLAQRYLPTTLAERLGRPVVVGEFSANPFLLTWEAREVAVEDDPGQAMISIRRVFVDVSLRGLVGGLTGGTWTLDSLMMEGLQAHLVRQADGSVNVVEAAQRWRQPKTQTGAPPAILIKQLAVVDAGLVITAMSDAGVDRASLSALQLRASNLSTFERQQPATYGLDASLPGGGALALTGKLTVGQALETSGQFSLLKFEAAPWLPFAKESLALSDLKGTVDLSGRFAHGLGKPLDLTDVRLNAQGVRVARHAESAPLLVVHQIAAGAGNIDLGKRVVQFGELLFKEGLMQIAATPGHPSGAERQPTASEPWTLTVPVLRLEQMAVTYSTTGGQALGDAPGVEVGVIKGRASLALTLDGRSPQVQVSGLEATFKDAALRGIKKGETSLRVTWAQVEGGRFDWAARELGAAKMVVAGSAHLVRSRSGHLVLPAPLRGSETARASSATGNADAAQPWRYAIDVLEVSSLKLALVDHGYAPALKLQATLRAQARQLVTGKPASFDATLSFADGAHLTAAGTAAVNPVQVNAQVNARSVALRSIQPVLEPLGVLSMVSGDASGAAQLRYDGRESAWRLDGHLDIADLRLNEAGTTKRFLAWRQLRAQGVALDLRADRGHLTVRDISVRQAEAEIVISENREVNLVQILQRDQRPASSTAAPASASKRESGPPLTFEIDQLRLQDSAIDFSDLSLLLPFSTKIKGLNGTIVDISSHPDRRAAVKAAGQIEPYGSASVEGGFIATAPSRFMRLDVQFNNVLVAPLSPYTATFAGRKVEAGRLWLGLEYRIENNELLGQNDIRLQNFKLGERVQAPSAFDVPLDLVVAMLTDGKGNIQLSVPVTGELGNARFSVASAVRQAISNVLQRVVTAPFRALASLFGGNPESLGIISFAPGSAKLRPQELEKLDALTRALRERPQLTLVVAAPHDPEMDASALRQEQARRALTQALGRGTGAGGETGPVSFDDPATQRALQNMFRSIAGENAVSDLAREFGDRPELFETMLERVAAAQGLSDSATQLLAVERARQIESYLLSQGIDRSRIETGRITRERGTDNAVSSRLKVGAIRDRLMPSEEPQAGSDRSG